MIGMAFELSIIKNHLPSAKVSVIPGSGSLGHRRGAGENPGHNLVPAQSPRLRLILRVGRVLLQDELLDQCIGDSSARVDEGAG
jgi:hypothetical protein